MTPGQIEEDQVFEFIVTVYGLSLMALPIIGMVVLVGLLRVERRARRRAEQIERQLRAELLRAALGRDSWGLDRPAPRPVLEADETPSLEREATPAPLPRARALPPRTRLPGPGEPARLPIPGPGITRTK